MGTHVNPNNRGFRKALKAGNYVDKTGLISYINSVLSTEDFETCFTRPRMFGKTTSCRMLAAYYSVGANSEDLFKRTEIEKDPTFREHLNKHPVISFDLLAFKDDWSNQDNDWSDFNGKKPTLVQYIRNTIVKELAEEYPDVSIAPKSSLRKAMLAVVAYLEEKENAKNKDTNTHQFVVIIDEWDLIIREEKDNPTIIDDYIEFLRSLFCSQDTDFYLAGAYMTGILPIIRYNTQSGLSDFREYTMLDPGPLARYVGFTQEDVHKVCQKFDADEQTMKSLYEGYSVRGVEKVYCPFSIVEAAKNDDYTSHWPMTSSTAVFTDYVYSHFNCLYDAIDHLLVYENVQINPRIFQNRLDELNTQDKLLTVFVHLGYLTYDYESSTVRIPNYEVRQHILDAFSEPPSKKYRTYR